MLNQTTNTNIATREGSLVAFPLPFARLPGAEVQICEYILTEKASPLKVLEDVSRRVFADNRGYQGGLLNGTGEITSFELTNGYNVLLVPDITIPIENPQVRSALAQLFVYIHAVRHAVFVDAKDGMGWRFEQADILRLDSHPHSPLAVIAQAIQNGSIDRAKIEFDNVDLNYLLNGQSHAKPAYHMICYEKADRLANPKKVAYSRFTLPAVSSSELPAHFSAESESALRELLLHELEKTDFLVFTTFSRHVKEEVDIHALIWCLENMDALIEVTRKLATRESLASLYAALALAPHLVEGRRRGVLGTVDSRELKVYRRTKIPYNVLSEFEDETKAHDNNILVDRAVLLYGPDLGNVRALIGEERVARLVSRYPEYRSGQIWGVEHKALDWPRDNIWPLVSQYDKAHNKVTMHYLRP